MVRPSRIPMVSMGEYENELGKDSTRLQRHVCIVIQSIIASIAKNSLQAHLNWIHVQDNSCELIKSRKQIFRKKKPFFEHWRMDHYNQVHGDLNTNGWLGKGHRFYTLDGVPGVLIADAPITKLELDEETAIELQEHVASSKDEGMTPEMLSSMHGSLSASLWNETSGGVGKSVDDMLAARTAEMAKEKDSNEKDKKDKKDDDPLADVFDCFASGVPGAQSSQLFSTSPPTPSLGIQDAPRASTPRKEPVIKTERPSPQAAPPVPKPRAKPQATPATVANQGKGAGRKKFDWESTLAEDLKAFSSPLQTDPLWWGSGNPTKRKDLEKKRDQVANRIRNCLLDLEEVKKLHKI